jgi:acyl-CoA synthetase (AMP-forming)/AMP-acid ligase II
MREPSSFRDASTLVEVLRWRAFNQPDQVAYIFLVDGESEEASITYGELDQQARSIAATLQERKAAGERVLLLYPSGLEFIAAFFGCLYAGAVAVPAYPPDPARLNRTLPRLQAIAKDSGAKFILTTQTILDIAEALFDQASDLRALAWLATDKIDITLSEKWKDPKVQGDTLAFLQYTSGSTASPKGVMISHDNLRHNAIYLNHVEGNPQNRFGVFWLPMYHDMGLIGGILQCVYCGNSNVLMSPLAFLQRPIRWLQAMSHYKATHSAAPNFAFDLCTRKVTPEQRETLDLSNWQVAYNGAEPIRQETIDRFVELFEPRGFKPEAMFPCYGLAEGTLIESGGFERKKPITLVLRREALQQNRVEEISNDTEDSQTLVGCGEALLNRKIRIVNPQNLTECPPGVIGEIWIAGPNVAQGYWNRAQETEESFHAHLRDTGEGPFFRTGDLGFLKNGELFVTGRLKDMLIFTGQNHYAQDIEFTVEKCHPSLRPGCGAAFSISSEGEERLVVVYEVDARQPIDLNALLKVIRRAVAENHDLQIHHVVFLEPKSIPKTSSGKIQRHACRTGYLSGTLEIIRA